MSDAILTTSDGHAVTLHGSGNFRGPGVALTGIQGWYATPEAKVSTTSRGQGDGGHDVAEADIMYESRIVTLGYRILAGADRRLALEMLAALDRLVHGLISCRIVDDGQDTYCAGGYYTRALEQRMQNPAYQNMTGDITLVFERPERLSTSPHSVQLTPLTESLAAGGLQYGPGYWTEWSGEANASASLLHVSNAGLRGLHYPLSYGIDAESAAGLSNVAILENDGTSRAYPVFEVHGPMDGVRIDFPGTQQTIACSQTIRDVPLILDCRSRTAQLGGQDVSRTLTRRGFPTIPPGGTLRMVLSTAGGGFVDCSAHDTYM